MDFPDEHHLRLALETAEARARLAAAVLPDRRCEDWRFGKPHRYAAELAALLEGASPSGDIRLQAPRDCAANLSPEEADSELLMRSIGSDYLLARHHAHFGQGVSLLLDGHYEEPIVITYETEELFLPSTLIMAAPGTKAHLIERHITHGKGCTFCARCIHACEGAELSVELREEGSGDSRALNITNITAINARVRHLSTHSGHRWAREETLAELINAPSGSPSDVGLYSANRLSGEQVLDQHTRQIHTNGGAASDLLYKNVIDDKATAVFAGNIYVAPGAHATDAYQANRNMLLSERATVHSLPGLEILADRVRCSHGSASAPMDSEQLHYLLSRGIPQHEAQMLVAEGFLADVLTRFRSAEQA